MSYIEIKNLNKIYNMGEVEIKALDNTSFNIDKGELVVILGPSGAGKTTCLNILGGMDIATSGEVIVDGRDISKLKGKDLIKYRRTDIGFVFQFYNLVQNLTVIENVELAVQLCKDHLEPEEVLDKVGLSERKQNFPSQLSGGEQQRVAIARALITHPAVILADEPTGNLDAGSAGTVAQMLSKASQKHNQTIIMVTHDRQMADYADKIITIVDGVCQ